MSNSEKKQSHPRDEQSVPAYRHLPGNRNSLDPRQPSRLLLRRNFGHELKCFEYI
jgi:hypothetical protein